MVSQNEVLLVIHFGSMISVGLEMILSRYSSPSLRRKPVEEQTYCNYKHCGEGDTHLSSKEFSKIWSSIISVTLVETV